MSEKKPKMVGEILTGYESFNIKHLLSELNVFDPKQHFILFSDKRFVLKTIKNGQTELKRKIADGKDFIKEKEASIKFLDEMLVKLEKNMEAEDEIDKN